MCNNKILFDGCECEVYGYSMVAEAPEFLVWHNGRFRRVPAGQCSPCPIKLDIVVEKEQKKRGRPKKLP